jgi:hypothetical protein
VGVRAALPWLSPYCHQDDLRPKFFSDPDAHHVEHVDTKPVYDCLADYNEHTDSELEPDSDRVRNND